VRAETEQEQLRALREQEASLSERQIVEREAELARLRAEREREQERITEAQQRVELETEKSASR